MDFPGAAGCWQPPRACILVACGDGGELPTIIVRRQLGVPLHIVERPAVLAVEVMELAPHHLGWAARIVETIPAMEQIARWVEAHDERPDGHGYSEAPAGDQIPRASRMLAIADSHWALGAPPPYRKVHGDAEALTIIGAGAGTRYDAELVELLGPALGA